ncbi:MAG: hypothetical protein WC485_03825 [Opitutaceae bacterium]
MRSFSPVSFTFASQKSIVPFPALLVAVLGVTAGASPGFGCSVCGCSLSSDWAAQGYSMMPGLQAGVRYEYFEQSDLRRGPHGADRPALTFPNDEEIQQSTLNRNTWLDLDYVANPAWAVTVQVPYHDRDHRTIAAGDLDVSTSQASGLGDLRLLGRYQHSGLQNSYSLQLGLKLPTGRFDQNFATGPQAGALLDRGLQLGTGTTDLLAGCSYFSRPSVSLGWFAQVMLDQPLASRDGFRPGASFALNGGLRLLTTGWLTPQIQLNARWDGRETGVNADHENSGATMVYASPGLTAELGSRCHAYAFVQLPVYQRVNGLQLEPRWLLSVGVRYEL